MIPFMSLIEKILFALVKLNLNIPIGRVGQWLQFINDSLEGSKHNLYADELSTTPEEAIRHQWSFSTN